MSAQSEGREAVRDAESQFEGAARALSEFVIRTAVLPFTLLMTKPSALARAAAEERYRPLPSPFLLALVTGVVISGVVSALFNAFSSEAGGGQRGDEFTQRMVDAFASFSVETDGMKAVLFSLPYLAFIWLAAGLVSLAMWRGVKNVSPLYGCFSLCISALIEVAAITAALALLLPPGAMNDAGPVLAYAFAAFALLLTVKLIRLIFVLRKNDGSSWIGAGIAVIPALLLMVIASAAVTATTYGIVYSRGEEPYSRAWRHLDNAQYEDAMAAANDAISYYPDDSRAYETRARVHMAMRQYESAAEDFGEAIARNRFRYFYEDRGEARFEAGDFAGAIEDFTVAMERDSDVKIISTYSMRCRARAAAGRDLLLALEDCNAVMPEDGIMLDHVRESRGLLYLKLGRAEEAVADFRVAADFQRRLGSDPSPSIGYGLGMALIQTGSADEGRALMAAAAANDTTVVERYERYGLGGHATPQAAPQQ